MNILTVSGPAPLPTAIKKLRGNPGKRPLNDEEPLPDVKMPDPPPFLDESAVREWNRMGPMLVRLGVLTVADGAVFAAYCQAFAHWEYLEKLVQAQGRTYINDEGVVVVSQAYWAACKARKDLMRACTELGITPSARSRIRVKQEDKDNPYAAWKKRGQRTEESTKPKKPKKISKKKKVAIGS